MCLEVSEPIKYRLFNDLRFSRDEWQTWNIRRLLTSSTMRVCFSLNFAPKAPHLIHPRLNTATHFTLPHPFTKSRCFYFLCFLQMWVMKAKCRQFMQLSGYRLQCACCRLRADIASPLTVPCVLSTWPVAAGNKGVCGMAWGRRVSGGGSLLLELGPYVKGAPSGNSALRNHRYAQTGKKETNECLVCVWACGKGLHFLSFCLFIDSQTTNSFNQ